MSGHVANNITVDPSKYIHPSIRLSIYQSLPILVIRIFVAFPQLSVPALLLQDGDLPGARAHLLGWLAASSFGCLTACFLPGMYG